MRATQCHIGNHRMYKIRGSDGREYGPATAEQMRQWLTENRVHAATLVQKEGADSWQPFSALPEFSDATGGSRPAPLAASGPGSFSSGSAAPRQNPMALTGMIMGIASLVTLCGCYGFPFQILGIIFSLIGLAQIKKSPESFTGRGMAIVGLVLSIFSIVLLVSLIAIFGTFFYGEIKKEMRH
jgi:hypothetical protein